MRIRNLDDLDHKIRELSKNREKSPAGLLSSSDRTRDVAGSVQQGFYLGQLALGFFRTLTNYHLPRKKRIQQVIVSISAIIVVSALRSFINKRVLKKGENE